MSSWPRGAPTSWPASRTPSPPPGGQALAVPTDVRDRDAIGRMVQAALDRWGRIDVLVNNAGVGSTQRLVDLDPARVREQVEVNLLAVIACSQAVLPAMRAQRSGHIVNIASVAGLIGLPGGSVYSATKFGVVGFSEGLRREVRKRGIHVTAFCPGFVATKLIPRLEQISDATAPATAAGSATRQAGRSLPGVMSTDYVAERIAGVIRRPRRLVIVPRAWGLLVWVARTFPGLADRIIIRFLK